MNPATSALFNVHYLINAIVFSVLGLVIFSLGFWVLEKLTPFSLWKEIIDEHNTALAIIFGAISIGICQIIASAIHS